MKNSFFKIATAVLSVLLVVSIVLSSIALSRSYSKNEIDALLEEYQNALKKDQGDKLSTAVATIDEQVASIHDTIDALKALDGELGGYVDALETEAETLAERITATDALIEQVKTELGEEITASEAGLLAKLLMLNSDMKKEYRSLKSSVNTLTQQDAEIKTSIAELRAYVDEELTGTEGWVKATFATIEQHEKVAQRVTVVETELAKTIKRVTTLETNLASRIAEVDTALGELRLADADLAQSITDAVDEVTKAYTDAIKSAKDEVTAAYTKAIQDAVEASETSLKSWVNGELDTLRTEYAAADADLAQQQSELQSSLDSQKTYLEGLITELKNYVDVEDEAIEEMIALANAAIAVCDQATKDNAAAIEKLREEELKNLKDNLTLAYTTAITNAVEGLRSEYEAADTALKTELEAAYVQADGELKQALEEAYAKADTELQNKLSALETAYKEKDDALQAYADRIAADLKTTSESLDKAIGNIEALDGKVKGIEDQIGEISTTLGALSEQVTTNSDTIAALQTTLKDTQAALDAAKEELADRFAEHTISVIQPTFEGIDTPDKLVSASIGAGDINTAVQMSFESVSHEDETTTVKYVADQYVVRYTIGESSYEKTYDVDEEFLMPAADVTVTATYRICHRYTTSDTQVLYEVACEEGLFKWAETTIAAIEADTTHPDLTLLGNITISEGKVWTPVGHPTSSDTDYGYKGNIKGGGYTIMGLTSSGTSNVAFLKILGQGGTIEGLSLAEVNVEATGYAAALAARVYYGTVTDCHILSGSVTTSKSNVAGITSYLQSGTLKDCTNAADILHTATDSSNGHAAGIVGYLSGSNVKIENCDNSGSVSSSVLYTAGICARVHTSTRGLTLSDCDNSGRIVGSGAYTGGIAALINVNGNTVELTNCTNSGEIVGSGAYTGGIAASLTASNTASVTLTGCENSGNVYVEKDLISDMFVTGTNDNKHELFVGGVVGKLERSSSTATVNVFGCTNSGSVEIRGDFDPSLITGTESTSCSYYTYLGGVVGYNNGGAVGFDVTTTPGAGCTNGGTVAMRGNNLGGTNAASKSISTYTYVGGVVGYNIGDAANGITASVTSCVSQSSASVLTEGITKYYNTGVFKSNQTYLQNAYCGGIVGYNVAAAEVISCTNEGKVGDTAQYIGGVVGYNWNLVQACSNRGEVTETRKNSNKSLGGIVAMNQSTGTVLDCYNAGTMSGMNVGGIAGGNNGTVQSCGNTGTLSGTNVGGIAETNRGTVQSCDNTGTLSGTSVGGIAYENSGTVEFCSNAVAVSGKMRAAGIVAVNRSDGRVVACGNTGDVKVTGVYATTYAGGVVANNSATTTDDDGNVIGGILGCYNTGKVTNENTYTTKVPTLYTGGIVGQNSDAAVVVKGCYSTGLVQAKAAHAEANIYTGLDVGSELTSDTINTLYVRPAAGFTADAGYTLGDVRTATEVDGTNVPWEKVAADMMAAMTDAGYAADTYELMLDSEGAVPVEIEPAVATAS